MMRIGTFGRRLAADQSGATIIEFGLAGAIFLAVLLSMMKFGLDFFVLTSLEKAAQYGARRAVVSDPAVAGLYDADGNVIENEFSGTGLFGQRCSNMPSPCIGFATQECTGAGCTGGGFDEIFARMGEIAGWMLAPENVTLRYEYQSLGFAGGPIIPLVTLIIHDVGNQDLGIVNPTGPFNLWAPFVGGAIGDANVPVFRVTLTGEDLGS